MLSQIFKNVYMRLDEKAVTMAQPQKMWSGIHDPPCPPCLLKTKLRRIERKTGKLTKSTKSFNTECTVSMLFCKLQMSSLIQMSKLYSNKLEVIPAVIF